METEEIRFEAEQDDANFLRRRSIDPSDFAREAFTKALGVAVAGDRAGRIRALRVKPPPGVDIVKLIREDRESH